MRARGDSKDKPGAITGVEGRLVEGGAKTVVEGRWFEGGAKTGVEGQMVRGWGLGGRGRGRQGAKGRKNHPADKVTDPQRTKNYSQAQLSQHSQTEEL